MTGSSESGVDTGIGVGCPSETGIDLFPSLLLTFTFCKNKIKLDKSTIGLFFYNLNTSL